MPNLNAAKESVSWQSIFGSVALLYLLASGCGSPSAANIALRKQQQTLQSENNQLKTQHQLDVETLAACQRSHPTTTALSPEQLENVVSTHGLKFGELTGGDNPDPTANVDSELKVYVVPLDGEGTPIKAAGAFTVQAFNLGNPVKPLIGTWTFEPGQVRKLFYNQLLLYTYVLSCPWQTQTVTADLTIRVTFDDTLTGREFLGQIQTKVRIADKK
jgi:hypothetical protein